MHNEEREERRKAHEEWRNEVVAHCDKKIAKNLKDIARLDKKLRRWGRG